MKIIARRLLGMSILAAVAIVAVMILRTKPFRSPSTPEVSEPRSAAHATENVSQPPETAPSETKTHAVAPEATSPTIEHIQPQWVALGIPGEVDRNQKSDFSQWKRYFAGFRQRFLDEKISATDAEIFTYFMQQVQGQDINLLWLFAAHAQYFRETPYASSIIQLCRALLDRKDESVRVFAASALSRLGDKESVDKILPLLSIQDERRRRSIKNALRRLGYELPVEEDAPKPKEEKK